MLFIAVVISTPFQLFKTPVAKDVAQEMTEAACMFVGNNFADRRIHYVDPLIPVKLNRDPYDGSQLVQWFKNPAHPEEQMDDGDLVMWDAHFTAHEGQLNFKTLDENPDFKRIAIFKPEHSHIIFGDEEYFVTIFEYIRQR